MAAYENSTTQAPSQPNFGRRLRMQVLRVAPLLATPVAVLLSCVAVSAIAVLQTGDRITVLQEEMKQAQGRRNDAAAKLRQAEDDKRTVREYQEAYRALRSVGLYGQERRLEWIEQIRNIQQQHHLFPIKYQIFAQQPVKVDAVLLGDELTLRASKMRWQMDLLHELDLLDFLDELRRLGGYYSTQECTLKRINDAQSGAMLSAECSLYWLTLSGRANTAVPPAPAH